MPQKSKKTISLLQGLSITLTRLKMSLKETIRDAESICILFFCLICFIGFTLLLTRSNDSMTGFYKRYDRFSKEIIFSSFLGTALSMGTRTSIIFFYNERKLKMQSYLIRAGVGIGQQYFYHFLLNIICILPLLLPFMVVMDLLYLRKFNLGTLLMPLTATLTISTLNVLLCLLISNPSTGQNVLIVGNFAGPLITGILSYNYDGLDFLGYFMPQNLLVIFFKNKYAMMYEGKLDQKLMSYNMSIGAQFIIQGLIFLIMFYILEKFVSNEYGFRNRTFFYSLASVFRLQNLIFPRREKTSLITTNGEEKDQGKRVVLEVDNLQKEYGTNRVLKGVNFSVFQGDSLCLLGCNGAGKSTLFNILLGNIEATGGGWNIGGQNHSGYLGNDSIRRIAYCPQSNFYWSNLTVQENFELVSRINQLSINGDYNDDKERISERGVELSSSLPDPENVNISDRKQKKKNNSKNLKKVVFNSLGERLDEIKRLCQLDRAWNLQAKSLSKGYRRRLTLALSLLTDSDVILLDEPTTALDAESRLGIMKSISKIKKSLGKTVVFTTHHLEEAQLYADRVAILRNGKISLEGYVDDLTSSLQHIEISIHSDATLRSQECDKITKIMEKAQKQEVLNIDLSQIDKNRILNKKELKFWIQKAENYSMTSFSKIISELETIWLNHIIDGEEKDQDLDLNEGNFEQQHQVKINLRKKTIEDVFLSEFDDIEVPFMQSNLNTEQGIEGGSLDQDTEVNLGSI